MKKRLAILLATILCLSLASPAMAKLSESIFREQAFMGDELLTTLYIDGKFLPTDTKPFIENGRTLIPFRVAAEAVGGTIDWNGTTKQATVRKGNTTLVFTLNQSNFTKNGQTYPLDVPVKLHKNRLHLPLRALSQALDLPVKWDNDYRAISIGKPHHIHSNIAKDALHYVPKHAEDFRLVDAYELYLLMNQKFMPTNKPDDPLVGSWLKIDENNHNSLDVIYIHHLKNNQYICYSNFYNLNCLSTTVYNFTLLENGGKVIKKYNMNYQPPIYHSELPTCYGNLANDELHFTTVYEPSLNEMAAIDDTYYKID